MNDTKEKQNNAIAPKIWNEYFRKLLNTDKKTNYNKWQLTQNELDKPLTREEITTELKNCKNNKSSSSSITFEMLKSDSKILAPYLQHLFNLVLTNETYPKLWNISLLVPIYKAGVHANPSNYRGIAVGNHISKLFSKCLNKRIDDFITIQNKLPDNSLGFRKGLRTEDGMFLLKTVTNKYTKLGKRLFTIFVDFSKFYDTINHEILLDKLFNFGVTGNLFNAIRNMYKGVSYSIKISNDGPTMITQPFNSNLGLKQGCPLSPTLANIFLHDIHDNLLQHDIKLKNVYFNSISWADDLVFFSLTPETTQKMMNSLSTYCKDMRLTINMDKTQAIVFSKGNVQYNKIANFVYNGNKIEFCKSYKYLGVEFQQNGKFKEVVKTRILKAQNAIYAINRACATANTSSIHVRKKLYKSKIFPILTYGSAIWGPSTNNRLQVTQNNDINKEIIRNEIKYIGIQIQDIRTNRTNKTSGSFKCNTYDDKLLLLQNRSLRSDMQLTSPPFDMHHPKIEIFLNSAIKMLLGIKKCAHNAIARIHISWKPISLSMWMATVKYWLRSYEPTSNLLLKSSFDEMHESNSLWKDGIQHILCSNGMQNIWQSPRHDRKDATLKYIKTRLTDTEIQRSQSEVRGSKKLSKMLQYLTITNELPNYQQLVHDPRHKKTLTKLRTHTHCLQTETGSYTKDETDPGKYNCPMCDMKVPEDVSHFLCTCPWSKYSVQRMSLINLLENFTPLNRFSAPQKVTKFNKALLDCDLVTVPTDKLHTIYSLIHKMYKIRERQTRVEGAESTQDLK